MKRCFARKTTYARKRIGSNNSAKWNKGNWTCFSMTWVVQKGGDVFVVERWEDTGDDFIVEEGFVHDNLCQVELPVFLFLIEVRSFIMTRRVIQWAKADISLVPTWALYYHSTPHSKTMLTYYTSHAKAHLPLSIRTKHHGKCSLCMIPVSSHNLTQLRRKSPHGNTVVSQEAPTNVFSHVTLLTSTCIALV